MIAADSTAIARGVLNPRILKGKALEIACPKLDSNTQTYVEKLVGMIDQAKIDTLTVLIMEVPCCGGLATIATSARERAVRNIPIKVIILGVDGEVRSEEWVSLPTTCHILRIVDFISRLNVRNHQRIKNKAADNLWLSAASMVIPLGLEPRTPTLKVLCSTCWASESILYCG